MVSQTPTAIVSDERTVVEPDGSHIVVARFRAGTFRLDLHVGSTDPPLGPVALPAGAGSVVSSDERPRLVGGFNGGFKASAGVGGFEVDGQVLVPLVTGVASVVIDASGTPSVGIWGQSVPAAGERPVSVRQNLPPLVEGGRVSPLIDQVKVWGNTIRGLMSVSRSGLGQDSNGDLLYAGSGPALPADLAGALVASGANTAMELDINPEWVQLDLSATAGGPLQAEVSGQNRPPDQYLTGWTRDFFTVLAKP